MSHERIRNTIKWGSYGKNGNEPLTERLLKDLSDEHLKNIITYIQLNLPYRGLVYKHMLNEVEYRLVHNIFVPEYINIKLGR